MEMSRKMPLFWEKKPPWEGNVPTYASFPGEKATVGRKCPEKHHISGRKFHSGMEMSRKTPHFREKVPSKNGNVLKTTSFPGESYFEEGKCPEKHHFSGRKWCGGGETSWFGGKSGRKRCSHKKCPGQQCKSRTNIFKWETSSLEASHILFADHDIKNHLIGGLHTFSTDAAEVADGLLNAIFNYTVIGRDADVVHCKDGSLD